MVYNGAEQRNREEPEPLGTLHSSSYLEPTDIGSIPVPKVGEPTGSGSTTFATRMDLRTRIILRAPEQVPFFKFDLKTGS